MRCSLLVLLCSLIGCTGGAVSPSPAEPIEAVGVIEHEPGAPTMTDESEYFLAVASQTGVPHCPRGGFEWIEVEPTLGWTPTSGDAVADLEPLMDQPVLARGIAGPSPARTPSAIEPVACPEMQMRSDWVNTPRGIRTHRSEPIPAGHFRLGSVRRLDELAVEAVADQVVASFQNPLPFALTGVRLRMHYEACHRKPNSRALESDPVTLEPGERLRYSFPQRPEMSSYADQLVFYRASSLALVIPEQATGGARVWTDLNVSLAVLGLAVECP